MRTTRSSYFSLLLMGAALWAMPIHAQERPATPAAAEEAPASPPQKTLAESPMAMPDPNVAPPVEWKAAREKYEGLTPNKFQKFLWRMGAYDSRNKDHVTEFLQGQECKMYQDNYKNDFLWPGVLKSTAAYLNKYRDSFLNKFYIVQPIALDNYDSEREWFTLTPQTQYVNETKIEFVSTKAISFQCGEFLYRPRFLPGTATLMLPSPFSLTYIPMKQNFAFDFMNYTEKNKAMRLGGKTSTKRYAYVKFYMTVKKPHGLLSPDSIYAGMDLEFDGRIDGLEIYADRELTLPLYTWVNGKIEKLDEQAPAVAPLTPQPEQKRKKPDAQEEISPDDITIEDPETRKTLEGPTVWSR